jgi:hypothetical protein
MARTQYTDAQIAAAGTKMGALGRRFKNVDNKLLDLQDEVDALSNGAVSIDDTTAAANKVYSSQKVDSQIASAVADLVGGADSGSDTLKEIADQVASNLAADAKAVSVGGSQSFTDAEKTQGRSNIGAASASEVLTLATDVSDLTDTVNGFGTIQDMLDAINA